MYTLIPPPKVPYHTSALTGEGWVKELLTGHPMQIVTELGVSHSVFAALIENIKKYGTMQLKGRIT
jgi:hypothetical protein